MNLIVDQVRVDHIGKNIYKICYATFFQRAVRRSSCGQCRRGSKVHCGSTRCSGCGVREGKFYYELVTVITNVLIERRLLICASYFFLQFGRTPLYAACKGGHKECIRLLLEAGADAKKPTKNGWEPIDMAKVSDFNCFWSFIYILPCVPPEVLLYLDFVRRNETRSQHVHGA